MQKHLFTPGPVNVPHEILMAGAAPMVSHRSEPWSLLVEKVGSHLERLLGADGPVILLPGSGTGALEALAVNLISPGDTVISFSCGVFGERFRDIVSRTAANIITVNAQRGQGFSGNDVKKALEEHPGAKALLFTHNETSTGVANPLEEMTSAVPDDGPLVLVDAVSSLGAMPCYPSKWRIDGLASCSQKGLLAPPGVSPIWLSERAWRTAGERKCPSYYFDLSMHRRFLKKKRPQNPYTPPVSLYYSLAVSLQMLEEYGWENRFESIALMAQTFETACRGMGLDLFVREKQFRSPALTSVIIPSGKRQQVKEALDDLGVIASEGQGEGDTCLRFAHYSPGGWPEVSLLAGSLFGAARDCGINVNQGFMEEAWKTWNREGR
ncbi:MAG: alanine--glyoxylate aminotransferase family protein [Syntrophorhabdus aromaticivorans]|uniref:Alanine--glyoxylate aminotransferase family protein n=1 Tax=Syntrophorhabdus aromaticivorans TaxID=328301 RepID=A0A971M368_9BACT|nr:alanine--glyoxylate aminotransferase family protein [Syntrophorhabdus aromaticivorans]